MADVRPLPGIRYASPDQPQVKGQDQVQDWLAALVTPPYDVISPEAQARYYARDPHNVIRLELGHDEPGDDALDNKYTRAAMLFADWRLQGVLRQDTPALYLYEQRFAVDGRERARLSLLTRVRLEAWEAGVILPHEQTLSKPKEDRLRVLRACAANLSPILALYDDPQAELTHTFAPLRAREPDVAFTDEAGERHRLWVAPDPLVVDTVAAFFSARPLYIADGHHRYETALAYRDELRELRKELLPKDAANFVLMALTALEDPGLVVLPTHRIIRGVAPEALATLPERLGASFTIEPLPGDNVQAWLAALARAGNGGQQTALALIGPWGAYLATLSTAGQAAMARTSAGGTNPPASPRSKMAGKTSGAWSQLDVAVLQELVLKEGLGITEEAVRAGERLSYTRDAEAAVAAVRASAEGGALAALLNSTPPAAMRDVARAGERMPQKSTYFYPKLITGLVINPLW
jgi:uncharacterized protein (DUF1015 family)